MFTSVTVRCAVFVLQIYNRWCAGLRQRISVFYIFHEKGQKRKDTASHFHSFCRLVLVNLEVRIRKSNLRPLLGANQLFNLLLGTSI